MQRSCPEYNTLRKRLEVLVPHASKPQQKNLALFVFGLLATWHVPLPKIARCLPGSQQANTPCAPNWG